MTILGSSQIAAVKEFVAHMQAAGVEDDDGTLDELVFDAKKNEAMLINQQGIEEQLKYLFGRSIGGALQDQKNAVLEAIIDHLPTGDLIECGNELTGEDGKKRRCSRHDFKSSSTQRGQTWICGSCSRGQ